jgi:hypothetical protein
MLDSLTAWLDGPLGRRARLGVLVCSLVLLGAYAVPMWHIKMYATQFPNGLELTMYPHKLTGGNDGRDVQEINVLNHYIGMRPLQQQDFVEMKWIPFALGVFVLLGLRAVVFGKVGNAVDLTMLFSYFGLFSLGSFYYRLWWYGHHLDPEAPITVAPFTPPLLGHHKLANFDVYSYPGLGSYLFAVFGTTLAVLLVLDWRARRRAAA